MPLLMQRNVTFCNPAVQRPGSQMTPKATLLTWKNQVGYLAPPQINFTVSVHLSVCLSVCPEYQKTWIFNVGINIRVST
jgi:hypothetical protein